MKSPIQKSDDEDVRDDEDVFVANDAAVFWYDAKNNQIEAYIKKTGESIRERLRRYYSDEKEIHRIMHDEFTRAFAYGDNISQKEFLQVKNLGHLTP